MRVPSPIPSQAPSIPETQPTHPRRARIWHRLAAFPRTTPRARAPRGASSPGQAQRRPDPPAPRLRIRWGAVGAVLAGLVFLAWLVVVSPIVGVREIAVAGVDGQERADIARIGARVEGQPLVKVDTDGIANAVIERGTVAAVDVERHWPTTLLIRVRPREAMYYVTNPQGGVQVFDGEGVPFWSLPSPPAGIPPVLLASPEDPAQRAAAAAVVRAFSAAQRADVDQVKVASPDSVFVTVGDIEVSWGSPDRSDVKAKIVDVLARRQGVTRINVVVPEEPVTGGGATPTPKP